MSGAELLLAGDLHGNQSGWDEDDARTADAVRRLTDPAGPGDELLDGVAELYRRRAHGRPDGGWLAAWQHLAELLDIAPHRAGGFLDEVAARLAGDDAAMQGLRTGSAFAQLAKPDSVMCPADDHYRSPRSIPAGAGPDRKPKWSLW